MSASSASCRQGLHVDGTKGHHIMPPSPWMGPNVDRQDPWLLDGSRSREAMAQLMWGMMLIAAASSPSLP